MPDHYGQTLNISSVSTLRGLLMDFSLKLVALLSPVPMSLFHFSTRDLAVTLKFKLSFNLARTITEREFQ